MLKKVLKLSIGLFIIGSSSFAQWGGSTTTTGDIYRSGNVGIGTGTYVPLKLTVFVNQQNDGIGLTGTASKDISLMYNMTAGAWNPLIQSGDHMLMWKATGIDDVNAGGLVIGPWSNYNRGLRITSAGNVGIGTGETSFHRLNVDGSTGTKEIWVANSPIKTITLQNNLTQYAWNPLTQAGDNLLMWKSSNPDQADAGGFVIAPWSNSNNGIRISSQGNVSIGTSDAGTMKLAVEGKIGARGIKVTMQTPFPDYVFGLTYELRPLASLSKYIDQNKHLPGIPSAAEVEKEGGVELGDMSVKLLEKVEELTLYILELNKKLEQQQQEIDRLKQSNMNRK
jgi:hypothetical protein